MSAPQLFGRASVLALAWRGTSQRGFATFWRKGHLRGAGFLKILSTYRFQITQEIYFGYAAFMVLPQGNLWMNFGPFTFHIILRIKH